jgi:CRP-like cAMP-binding protein
MMNSSSASNQLKIVLNYVNRFSDEEFQLVETCFKPKQVKQGQHLLISGETCKEFYFVAKGCIRTYFIDKKGVEKTRYIMPANYIGTALASFISKSPSFELIDALCDSELLSISHKDFYRLNDELPGWKNFYQKILEMAYSFQTHKIESIVTLSAKQRFEQVMKEHPILFQLVSNRILASYLDMTPETLSRMKSQ